MFDVAWDELALIAVVSLIVIGPKDLPKVMRQAGRWARKAREMAAEFQRGVDDMMRESELGDLKQEIEKASDTNALRRQVEAAIDPGGDIARGMAPPTTEPPPATAAAPPEPPPVPEEPSALPPSDIPAALPSDPIYQPPKP